MILLFWCSVRSSQNGSMVFLCAACEALQTIRRAGDSTLDRIFAFTLQKAALYGNQRSGPSGYSFFGESNKGVSVTAQCIYKLKLGRWGE